MFGRRLCRVTRRGAAGALGVAALVAACGAHPVPTPAAAADPNGGPGDGIELAGLDPAQPLAVPAQVAARTWSFVPLRGAACANGNATGYAVNLVPDSNQLVVFFAGGGACGSYEQCYLVQAATFVAEGYTAATFEAAPNERSTLERLFVTNRDDPSNPFPGASYAYVPYCTGDLHAGAGIATYPPHPAPTHHQGSVNAGLALQNLAATLPQVRHVWLAGVSAGGFGAVFNRDPAAARFSGARVDVIDDSGLAFADAVEPASWKLQVPAACGCGGDFTQLLAYTATSQPAARVGLLSYSHDNILPLFFGITPDSFATRLAALQPRLDGLANLHDFVTAGSGHVVLQNSGRAAAGMGVADWLTAMVADDPNWRSAVDPNGT